MARLTIPDEATFAEFTVVTSTSVFPITFSFFAKADLTVKIDGVALEQPDFSIPGATLLEGGGYDGANVTLNTAVDDVTVRIERNVAPARTSNFAPASSTPVQSIDAAFNRLTMVQQDQKRREETNRAYLDAAIEEAGSAIGLVGKLDKDTNGSDIENPDDVRVALGAASEEVGIIPVGVVKDGSTQTAAVQTALDALPDNGALYIPRGVKFSRKGLTYPKNGWLIYFIDDNVDVPPFGTQRASGERVIFSFNSSYDEIDNQSGGMVNEQRLSSPWGTGHVVDTATDVLGHDAYLGEEQDREDDPALAFRLWAFDTVNAFGAIAKNSYTVSPNDGMQFYAYRNQLTLNGVGTSAGDWAVTPVVGALLEGATSGARAEIVSVSAGAIVVIWKRGKFAVGEAVIHAGETSASTITTIDTEQKAGSTFGTDFVNCNWGFNIAPRYSKAAVSVGGAIIATKTYDYSQHIYETIVNPRMGLADDLSATAPNYVELVLNVTPAAAQRRVRMTRDRGVTMRGHVGAVGAYTYFNDAGTGTNTKSATSENVATVSKNTTGDYTVTFTTAFAAATYIHTLTSTDPDDCLSQWVKGTTSFRFLCDDRNKKWEGSKTFDPVNLAAGAEEITTVTVTGARASCICTAALYSSGTTSVTLSGVEITAWWSAANTLSVRFKNTNSVDVDLPSGTLTAYAKGVGLPMDMEGFAQLICVGGDFA